MNKINIYVVGHKKVQRFTSDPNFKFIGVGPHNHSINFDLTDDIGENISNQNNIYCELTALYWIWKNIHNIDFLGLLHYRRFFYHPFKSFFRKKYIPYSSNELLSLLKKVDVILPKPYRIQSPIPKITKRDKVTYQSFFSACGLSKVYLDITRLAIQSIFPNYVQSFDMALKSIKFHYANVLVCSISLLDEYCNFLFPLLKKIEELIKDTSSNIIPDRILGYISEILIDTFFLNPHKKYKIKELPLCNNEAGLYYNLRNLI